MENKNMKPESMMMSYGYNPHLSEGALKCPIFQTSTFVFHTAEEGKLFFEMAYGKRKDVSGEPGLIYSRINNPDLEILEDRLTLWDKAEAAAVFESGMSAISTVLLEFLKPGDLLLYSSPLYGGTHHFIHHVLNKWGVQCIEFRHGESEDIVRQRIFDSEQHHRLAMIYVETPANPTNDLIDIAMCRRLANSFTREGKDILVAVDNTYMGPLWQHPLQLGADLVLYSATKYIGGHSDTVAGVLSGSRAHMEKIFYSEYMTTGAGATPFHAWLLLRGLRTLPARLEPGPLDRLEALLSAKKRLKLARDAAVAGTFPDATALEALRRTTDPRWLALVLK